MTRTLYASTFLTVSQEPDMSITIHASPSALMLGIACGVLVLWILATRRGRR